jgi:hypothetical protein
MSNLPVIPDIPSDASPKMKAFLQAIKEMVETREGLRGDLDDQFVTRRDLENLTKDSPKITTPFVDEAKINPPTNMQIDVGVWTNTITWVDPPGDHLAGIEVWYNTTNSITEAIRIAVVPKGVGEYKHDVGLIYVNRYYWIRATTYAGKYSTWVPTSQQGGMFVPAATSVNERIDGAIDSLLGSTPDLYNPATAYQIDDLVMWQDPAGNTKRFRRRNYLIGATGIAPSNTLYWKRVGILMQGDVNGEATVGIDGNLLVSGSLGVGKLAANSVESGNILANAIKALHIDAGQISAGHIAANTITGAQIQAGSIGADRIAANSLTANQIAANAITSSEVGANNIITNTANITSGIIRTAHIQDANISTLKIAGNAVTVPVSAYTAAEISSYNSWLSAQQVSLDSGGCPVQVFATIYCHDNGAAPTQRTLNVRILRGGTDITGTISIPMNFFSIYDSGTGTYINRNSLLLTVMGLDAYPPTGSNTYYVQVYHNNGWVFCSARSMFAIGVKR